MNMCVCAHPLTSPPPTICRSAESLIKRITLHKDFISYKNTGKTIFISFQNFNKKYGETEVD